MYAYKESQQQFLRYQNEADYIISVGSYTVKPLLLMRSADASWAVDSFEEGSGNFTEFPEKHSDIFNPPTGVIYRDQSALDQWIKNKTAPETVSWNINNTISVHFFHNI